MTLSSDDFFDIGEMRAFSVGSVVKLAPVVIALVTLLKFGSVLAGDVLSPSDESCLRLRYSLMDNWRMQLRLVQTVRVVETKSFTFFFGAGGGSGVTKLGFKRGSALCVRV